jgi:hypothetical protein
MFDLGKKCSGDGTSVSHWCRMASGLLANIDAA